MIRSFILVGLLANFMLADDCIYVVQSLEETLAEVNLTQGSTDDDVMELSAFCNEITFANSHLYVATGTSLQEIDPQTNALVREVALPGCASPWTCAILNADTLLVSCWSSDNVVIVRLSDGEVVGGLAAGNGPEGILVYGDRVYVAVTNFLGSSYGPGYVVVYDRYTLQPTDSLAVSTNPQSMAVDYTGMLHVVCTGEYVAVEGRVEIFNATTLQHVTSVPVGGTPSTVSFGGSVAYLAAGGWGDSGVVLTYAMDDYSVIHSSANPLNCSPGATDIEATLEDYFFVTCFAADKLEYRNEEGSLIAEYLLGDGPGYMARVTATATPFQPKAETPTSYRLIAYPNPFNGAVQVAWDRPLARTGFIHIYNNLGRMVAALMVPANSTRIQWSATGADGGALSSGAYYAAWSGPPVVPPVRLNFIK